MRKVMVKQWVVRDSRITHYSIMTFRIPHSAFDV
jgi:hypothetical protein